VAPTGAVPAYGHHAQNDRWIAEAVFPGQRGGWFVEAGACGGWKGSASYVLEVHLGWHGICVEPADHYFRILQERRSCRCDPRCLAATTGDRVEFLYFPEHLPRSGILSTNKNVEWAAERGLAAKTAIKETVTLADLLEQHAAPSTIEYLCLDVEGAERDILGAFDFGGAHRLLAVSVEGGRCDDLLAAAGYVRAVNPFAPDDIDHYFLAPELASKRPELRRG
jgi:FkbM family methyltransferase